ncbi:MAG: hypothetical protein WCH62_08365, partial [Candidatus Omnitrophota bacterium]
RLIKEGAKIVLSVEELLQELGLDIKTQLEQHEQQGKSHVPLSVEEYKLYEFINHQPSHIDAIAMLCRQEVGVVIGLMLTLELKGVIKQLPGQFYVRL